ncbi:MAG: hypothetical protein GXX08_04925 [Firmicutes bacterium]|nr:hypothetical protein [Bacillota bacterium]
MIPVLYVVYTTLSHARRVLSEGNLFGAIAISILCAIAAGMAVYQLFLR